MERRIDDRQVKVPSGPVVLEGTLSLPDGARGLVLFAHGSGSSRFSPRNRHVARILNEASLATLLNRLRFEETIDPQRLHAFLPVCLGLPAVKAKRAKNPPHRSTSS